MGFNIRANVQTPVRIEVQDKNGIIKPTNVGYVTMKSQAVAAPATSLSALTDVHLTQTPPSDGSTIIYNANTSVYDVKQPSLDGGFF